MKKNLSKVARKFYSELPETESPMMRALGSVRLTLVQAARNYEPKVYPGRVTLFWGSGASTRPYEDWRLGWAELASGGMEVHVVPGDHVSIYQEPFVAVLAEKLKACIERAQATEHTLSWMPAEAGLQSFESLV
jgi:thioesterase domain-containing protein